MIIDTVIIDTVIIDTRKKTIHTHERTHKNGDRIRTAVIPDAGTQVYMRDVSAEVGTRDAHQVPQRPPWMLPLLLPLQPQQSLARPLTPRTNSARPMQGQDPLSFQRLAE